MKNKHLIAALTALTTAGFLVQIAAQSISALTLADRMEGFTETVAVTDENGETVFVPVTTPVLDTEGNPVTDENGEVLGNVSYVSGWEGALRDTENQKEGEACIRSDPEFAENRMTFTPEAPLDLSAYGADAYAELWIRIPEETDRARLSSLSLLLSGEGENATSLPLLSFITDGEWTRAVIPFSYAVTEDTIDRITSVSLVWETKSAAETMSGILPAPDALPKITVLFNALRFGTGREFAVGVPTDGASVFPLTMLDGGDAEVVTGHYDHDFMAEGLGCLTADSVSGGGVSLSFRFDQAKDLSALSQDGGLYLWLYCSDAARLGKGYLELSSAGKSEVSSSRFLFKGLTGLKDGWNEILLPLRILSQNGDAEGIGCDLSAVDFIRISVPDAPEGFLLRADKLYAGLLSDFSMEITYDPIAAGDETAEPVTEPQTTKAPPRVFEEPLAPAVTESDFRIFLKENRTPIVLLLVGFGMLITVLDAYAKKRKSAREAAAESEKK